MTYVDVDVYEDVVLVLYCIVSCCVDVDIDVVFVLCCVVSCCFVLCRAALFNFFLCSFLFVGNEI